jgi:hypothetical protein
VVLTDDPASTRRASAIFEQLCNEPVRKDYLQKCIEAYRPPKFIGGPPLRGKRKKLSQGKVWIIGGLQYRGVPEREEEDSDRVIKKARTKLLDFEHSKVDSSHYAKPQSYFRRLREGDWLIVCVKDDRGFDVWPPARFMGIDHYDRGGGKHRYMLLYEVPTSGKSVRWSDFRSAVPKAVKAARGSKPRTTPITNEAEADALLRLWSAKGKFQPKRSA